MLVKLLATSSIQSPVNLGPDQIYVRANSGQNDRVDDEMDMQGADIRNYLKNPVVLSDHDSTKVVGNFAPVIRGSAMEGVVTFAPAGISALADELRAMYKANVRRAFSIGFSWTKREPKKGGGYRYLAWQLLELSCVSIPCDADALMIARSLSKSGRVLSAANATKLKQAHDLAENSRSLIADVIGSNSDDTDETDDPGAKAQRAKRLRQLELLRLSAEPKLTPKELRDCRMRDARQLEIDILSRDIWS
jgi:hypothetical protein